ncbi:signal peptidase I [Enterococcus sp. CWB-B31]|uniref:signal peptidase I n=1 Tax=Enterococcus sp. CWB-B31 TaxID=2885159 RepID=UPI001E47B896|nr:signal peptidase I [Enterococcus sp. CWB-B31]MCB5953445.1 signal peptidase I [Enterococcus sp. CWB-B31]
MQKKRAATNQRQIKLQAYTEGTGKQKKTAVAKQGKKQRKTGRPASDDCGNASSTVNLQKAAAKKKKRVNNTEKPKSGRKRRSRSVSASSHTYVKMKKRKQKRSRILRTFLIELGLTVAIVSMLAGSIGYLTLSLPVVDGYGMTPTLNDQERLLVRKQGSIKRFSLVYIKNPQTGQRLIRRVIGLPGETVEYQEGHLWIDGEEIPERFLSSIGESEDSTPATANFILQELLGQSRVPQDSYFVLGDNRRYASDSRSFGFVSEEVVIGVVTARIFPLHQMTQF